MTAQNLHKQYLLFAFPYPSGSGLHVGHVESMTALDIVARMMRMQGKQVFFPIGWDAFGLPAENYAIKTGIHPKKTTTEAIANFKRQIKEIGISYDWENELSTCDPDYYRWTQWLFLQLYQEGLAYQGQGRVNWCPSCQTVLANEQVVEGKCERCETQVIQKDLKQWYFKISKYRDELISGLAKLDWPKATKDQQLNWIGRSQGVTVCFQIQGAKQGLSCFTTRIDTICGVTFIAISPEKFEQLDLVKFQDQVLATRTTAYIKQAYQKTEEQRKIGEKDKTGVDTGLKALSPVSQDEVPIFVTDYVLAGYGTGVVMGVPAHDERDWAFAKKHQLPIREGVKPMQKSEVKDQSRGFTGYGLLVNSGKFDGLSSQAAIEQIPHSFSEVMEKTTTYKLRDWLISRQRYWGVPIPIVYDPQGQPHPVKDEHLPWLLPEDVDFRPTGESPLKSSAEFIKRTERLYGPGWRPEFDTMDTFVDSSWYYLRYTDPKNNQEFASQDSLKQWLPVDFYMIGPEHIVLHLLYSRFFTKFLRDQGYLDFDEPFLKMRHQGMILGPDGKKMSKSKGNVINPDEVVKKFGPDTLRLYEMFMGPIEADKAWNTNALAGIYRFLERVRKLAVGHSNQTTGSKPSVALTRKLQQTIKKVTKDLPKLKFNTAIAAMMELVNLWEAEGKYQLSQEQVLTFLKILAPLAPFVSQELAQELKGVKYDLHQQSWPAWDEELAREEQINIPVQVNGKVRGQIEISHDLVDDKKEVLSQAKSDPKVKKWLRGKQIVKEIYVSGRVVNFVIS